MEISNRLATMRVGGSAAITGSLAMLAGAGLSMASGTDLWGALVADDMAAHLSDAGGSSTLIVANLFLWVAGVILLGIAGTMFTDLCEHRPSIGRAAQVCFRTAVPMAIVAFIIMAAVTVQIAPDTTAIAVADASVLGWIGARLDDLATVLLIGYGPLLMSVAARGDWMPVWLSRWGWLAGLAGVLSNAVMFLPHLYQLGLIIVPIGIGWMLAAGMLLSRRSNRISLGAIISSRGMPGAP